MMTFKSIFLVALAVCGAAAWGQSSQRNPRIGYIYPDGACRGATVEVAIGGQNLRGITGAHISGEGVQARVVQFFRPTINLDKDQRLLLQRRLQELTDKRIAELPPAEGSRLQAFRDAARKSFPKPSQADAATTRTVTLPDHPLLQNLESKSLRELRHVADEVFLSRKKKQPNSQIAESVQLEITVDSGAAAGDRELRLKGPGGLTNPLVFQIGTLPEFREQEPNDPKPIDLLPKEPPIELPAMLNGQIMPGDVDRFRFRAVRGQRLVIQTQARALIPYLADAVPGWFQATLALYDGAGKEVAFADDFRFDPDPVLFYEVPSDGIYELEIRDSIYRGREDFVYRIAVGELPFITHIFPLGGQADTSAVAAIDGWNLPVQQLTLDTRSGVDGVCQIALGDTKFPSNAVDYAVDTLPECLENEPNDNAGSAQRITLPGIVNGRVARAGDVDVFRFDGHAGQELVAEVFARRLRSPLDSLVKILDASGGVVAWNDDYVEKDGTLYTGTGWLTHHADSYVRARLPKDGVYYVLLADTQNQGGDAWAYRLRVSAPRPDFALCLNPSSLSLRPGSSVAITVHAERKDGFNGDIDLALKEAPAGFSLSGGRIPAGRNSVRMTLAAPAGKTFAEPFALLVEGRADVGGQAVVRPAAPVEDMMQAFLWRHLAPSRELLVAVADTKYKAQPLQRIGEGPVRIPEGGTARMRLKAPRFLAQRKFDVTLSDPPQGVALGEIEMLADGMTVELKATEGKAKAGLRDNLIVEVLAEYAPRSDQKDVKAAKAPQRVSLGVLPAIPIEIVAR